MLTLYFVLLIRCGINDEKIKKYEFFFHLLPLAFGLSTAIPSLVNEWYNNARLWCWLAGFDDENDDTYRWLFYYGPLCLCMIFVSIGTILIYIGVHLEEKESVRHQLESRRVLVSPYMNTTTSDHAGAPPPYFSFHTDLSAELKFSMNQTVSLDQTMEPVSKIPDYIDISDRTCIEPVTNPVKPPDRFPEEPPKSKMKQGTDKEAKKRAKFVESIAKQSMLREMAEKSKRNLERTRQTATQAMLHGEWN